MNLINFNRPPSSPATQRQRRHIARLLSIAMLCKEKADVTFFIATAGQFLGNYDNGLGTQNQYADCLEVYRDIQWGKG